MDFFSFVDQFGGDEGFGDNFTGSHFIDNGAEDDWDEKATSCIPATVRMISGCQDSQTSADVSNIQSFGLPEDSWASPGGAGGACTCSFISAMEQNPNPSWIELLETMRGILDEKGYSQIPEISASRRVDLAETFEVQGGQQKALLVGINYIGMQGELRGCCNDVASMKAFLEERGFNDFRVLTDDGSGDDMPTSANILEGFEWLVDGAQAGDSLFFHYSGHGGSLRALSDDEKDGKDETIVPLDYQETGQIRDNTILQSLVLPLPAGCQLTALMDCCHSGTVLDLPYLFTATDENLSSANEGYTTMPINSNFDLKFALNLAKDLFRAYQEGGPSGALKAGMTHFMNNASAGNFMGSKFGMFQF